MQGRRAPAARDVAEGPPQAIPAHGVLELPSVVTRAAGLQLPAAGLQDESGQPDAVEVALDDLEGLQRAGLHVVWPETAVHNGRHLYLEPERCQLGVRTQLPVAGGRPPGPAVDSADDESLEVLAELQRSGLQVSWPVG